MSPKVMSTAYTLTVFPLAEIVTSDCELPMGVVAEPEGMPSVPPIVKAETLTVHIPITRRTARMTGIIFFIIHPPKNKIKGHFIWYILYLYKSSRHGDFNNRPEVRRLLRITRPGSKEDL